MTRRLFCLQALVLFAALVRPAFAAETFDIGPAAQSDLAAATMWCEAPADLPFAAVLTGGCHFAAAGPRDMRRGFSGDAFWLRLTLRNPTAAGMQRWLAIGHARLELAEFYVSTDGHDWRHAISGAGVPAEKRALRTTEPVLPLIFQPGESQTVLVRVVSRTSINMAPTLWWPKAYEATHRRLSLLESAAIGALLMASLLPLMIFLQWRDRAYLYFSACQASKAVFNASVSGLLSTYFLPDGMAVDIWVSAAALALTLEFFVLFVVSFADSRRNFPRFHMAFCVLSGLIVLETGWVFLVSYGTGTKFEVVTVLAVIACAIALFWQGWRRGMPGSGYMLISYALYLAFAVHRILLLWVGIAYDDRFAMIYSWEFLLTVPIGLIGLTVHNDRMRAALNAVRAENAARLDFLARMSHELRTPLDIILGNAQLLSRASGRLSLAEGLANIRSSGEHLLRMIDDILDHVRGVAGRLALTPRPVEFATFLHDVASNGELLASRNANRFSLTVTGQQPGRLLIDPDRLRQVLDNLLTNAARHTRDGWIRVGCQLRSDQDDVRLDFSVADSGEGIAAADQERIFRPFERAGKASSREGKGIGMGLAISRQLVDLMGGTLAVESRPGKGACFSFSIPVRCDANVTETARQTAPFPPSPAHRGTILLVEDEAPVRRVLAALLQDCGFAILEAAGGHAGVSLPEAASQIDLVVTDQFMAEGDGWQVLQQMRGLRPEIPVVMVSAAPPRTPDGFPAGLDFDAHLLKPLNHDSVLRCIGDLLGFDLETKNPASPPLPAHPPRPLRPGAPALRTLRQLIEGGQVSDIIDWSEHLRAETPPCAAFAERVATAARMLDFPELETLSKTDR